MQSHCTPGAVPPSGIRHRFSSFPVRFRIAALRDRTHWTPEDVGIPVHLALDGQRGGISSVVQTTHHLRPE